MCPYWFWKNSCFHHTNSSQIEGKKSKLRVLFEVPSNRYNTLTLIRSHKSVVSEQWSSLRLVNWHSRHTESLSVSARGQGSKFMSSPRPRQMPTLLVHSRRNDLVSRLCSREDCLKKKDIACSKRVYYKVVTVFTRVRM